MALSVFLMAEVVSVVSRNIAVGSTRTLGKHMLLAPAFMIHFHSLAWQWLVTKNFIIDNEERRGGGEERLTTLTENIKRNQSGPFVISWGPYLYSYQDMHT